MAGPSLPLLLHPDPATLGFLLDPRVLAVQLPVRTRGNSLHLVNLRSFSGYHLGKSSPPAFHSQTHWVSLVYMNDESALLEAEDTWGP